MKKRIVICADGTWNRPESDPEKDVPTNVLKFSRAVAPADSKGAKQIVFYDWGIGSYHGGISGGAFGKGLEKNVMDCYRFIVHNYDIGDDIFLFGFSRGAYTVRSLCGMINNCSILKGSEAARIEEAFSLYKNSRHSPNGTFSRKWRKKFAVEDKAAISFLGVWDTVGALGPPVSFFGLLENKHLFYDRKIGSNIKVARHALSLDEKRNDFEPTFLEPRPGVDLRQVWFAGVHSDIGGGYKHDKNGYLLSDIPMRWMQAQAEQFGLSFEPYFKKTKLSHKAKLNRSYKKMFKLLGKKEREIPNQSKLPTYVHTSVKKRWDDASLNYRSKPLEKYISQHGKWPPIEK